MQSHSRDPFVKPTRILDLRPTQITVGMREVADKRRRWRREHGKHAATFLGRHMIPIVMGPKQRPYVIDHHHLALALHQEGVEHVLTTVFADFGHLQKDAFWTVLGQRGLAHPFDATGKLRAFADIPVSLVDLVDDPYRSLAGALRRAGGYAKDALPFSEFMWADFLRRRIKLAVVDENFERALKQALTLARKPEANYLPGWCGPINED
ncbi:chromosome partitioning protein ParB [Nordella sp. HKS 07]|uniref:ParB-like protein n=1 Tax=Nordella sp. HKS 07 TaxID=2712222 RepID=UPI0013E1DA8D|nr:ParB-like protein [Nordella sp. HKS 07]QIG49833.1 chromosome partitioning protein ParB [Nordella sp. HKS 07]